jgi:hypothetical protein
VKKWLADSNPCRIIAVVTEQRATELRNGMRQPQGVAPRRPVGAKVFQSINKHAGPCKDAGIIPADAAEYLLAWSQGTWPRKPRPTQYSFLNHRWKASLKSLVNAPEWQTPARRKVVNLALDEFHSSSDAEEEAAMPIDWAEPER